jgi:hypothetical protein
VKPNHSAQPGGEYVAGSQRKLTARSDDIDIYKFCELQNKRALFEKQNLNDLELSEIVYIYIKESECFTFK